MYPSSQSVKVTQPVKFTTTVSGVGKENFSYQLRHNGENINGETSNTLTIDSVTRNDVGKYNCMIKNEFGDSCICYNAVLTIEGKHCSTTLNISMDLLAILYISTGILKASFSLAKKQMKRLLLHAKEQIKTIFFTCQGIKCQKFCDCVS